ncbi:MAG: DUF4402 domain-containing protein [Bacteroidales bacterium]|nr:DUF4402 domain-containing protein [Bacteroidales bacterium]MCF8455488.1 DUF4402 domain-containing protein [Bacteroidales bacterium]
MKTISKLSALAIVMILFATSTFAQVTATASASAQILTPIAITKTVDMNFGNLAVNATSGTIVLTPASSRSNTGGVTFLNGNNGTVTAASFTVTGLADATYSITLPAGATTISYSGNDMTVDSWTSTPTPTGTLTGGTQTLNVGATLNVPASSPAGLYTSATPFEVTVNYN